ncbi:hypothetical protein A2U01_0106781, partial [Trifolium medium]|nr:hypothetical protein [Trifolium medium]
MRKEAWLGQREKEGELVGEKEQEKLEDRRAK